MSQREHEAAEKQTSPANPQSSEPTRPAQKALLRLQSSAGNRAVARAVVVQRQGNRLNQLPPELIRELGGYAARASGTPLPFAAAARDASGSEGRHSRAMEGGENALKSAYKEAARLRVDLAKQRDALQQRKTTFDRLRETHWFDNWLRSRNSLGEYFASDTGLPNEKSRLIRQGGRDELDGLPTDAMALRLYLKG